MTFKQLLSRWFMWNRFKKEYRIDDKKVVLVLAGENRALDMACMDHLNDIAKRKYADSVLVFFPEGLYGDDELRSYMTGWPVNPVPLPVDTIDELYGYYGFFKFSDNIVFTHADKPADNMLKRYLDETDVNEEDAACLALYHLRYVPERPEVSADV